MYRNMILMPVTAQSSQTAPAGWCMPHTPTIHQLVYIQTSISRLKLIGQVDNRYLD